MSKTLVILPTFNRPKGLTWSLAGVLAQNIAPEAHPHHHVVVVNNGGEIAATNTAVDAALRAVGSHAWDLRVEHRGVALPPGVSWYEGIRQYGEPEDIVFLHSDDDLMVQNSILAREEAIRRSGAMFAMSTNVGGAYFGSHLDALPIRLPDKWWRLGSRQPRTGELSLESIVNPGFISIHTYRYGEALWDAYGRSVERLTRAPFSEYDKSSGYPFMVAVDLVRNSDAVFVDCPSCIAGAEPVRTSNWDGIEFRLLLTYLLERTDYAALAGLDRIRHYNRRQLEKLDMKRLPSLRQDRLELAAIREIAQGSKGISSARVLWNSIRAIARDRTILGSWLRMMRHGRAGNEVTLEEYVRGLRAARTDWASEAFQLHTGSHS